MSKSECLKLAFFFRFASSTGISDLRWRRRIFTRGAWRTDSLPGIRHSCPVLAQTGLMWILRRNLWYPKSHIGLTVPVTNQLFASFASLFLLWLLITFILLWRRAAGTRSEEWDDCR